MFMEYGGKMVVVLMLRIVFVMMELLNVYDCEYFVFYSVNFSERLMGFFYVLVDILCERKIDK